VRRDSRRRVGRGYTGGYAAASVKKKQAISAETISSVEIDHLFYTEQWELDHPNCYLQALSFSMSDHLPFTPYTYACSTPPKGFQI
jgi:endonuclease/exonuclease/phosphatase family metal-dependent hydrolase